MRLRRPPPRTHNGVGRRFIICCEGEGEERYLDLVRIELRLSKERIVISADCGTDPLSIVTEADQLRSEQKRDGTWATGDLAWAVFDGDEHLQNDKENWDQAMDLVRRKRIEVVVSNPSLELWYLLHFQDQQAPIHRDHVKRALRQYVPDYDKKMAKIAQFYQEVRPGQPAAIYRAKELAARHQQNNVALHTNPSTGFCILMEHLRQLRRPD